MKNQKLKMEKEFYSKVCVAASLAFVVDEARDENIKLTVNDKFACNIATILARDKEVVAVRLIVLSERCIILISKNGEWLEKDNTYIRKIEQHLKYIAEHPFHGKSSENRDVLAFRDDVMDYCYSKLQTRFEKLRRDITNNRHSKRIKYFVEYASKYVSIDVSIDNINKVNLHQISIICYDYYCLSIKANPNANGSNPK